jgi:hypothetical protein
MAIEVSWKMQIKYAEETLTYSLRRCEPYQVQRDYLNSFRNTPKAVAKIVKLI